MNAPIFDAPVFVDTNIFIYSRDSSDISKQSLAQEWLQRLWRERAGRTSVQVLSEYYVNVTRKLKPGLSAERAWEDVEALQAWAPQPIDTSLLNQSRDIERHHRLSWWDSLIVAAAQQQRCVLLLSEALSHGAQYGDVKVCNPFRLSVSEAAATYSVDRLSATPRHRKPGRPARRTGGQHQ
jgi:predicted nucleic acid-binding protein